MCIFVWLVKAQFLDSNGFRSQKLCQRSRLRMTKLRVFKIFRLTHQLHNKAGAFQEAIQACQHKLLA